VFYDGAARVLDDRLFVAAAGALEQLGGDVEDQLGAALVAGVGAGLLGGVQRCPQWGFLPLALDGLALGAARERGRATWQGWRALVGWRALHGLALGAAGERWWPLVGTAR
jgi:hypothetical protein